MQRLINRNMRCIEISACADREFYAVVINRNMRCIEILMILMGTSLIVDKP